VIRPAKQDFSMCTMFSLYLSCRAVCMEVLEQMVKFPEYPKPVDKSPR